MALEDLPPSAADKVGPTLWAVNITGSVSVSECAAWPDCPGGYYCMSTDTSALAEVTVNRVEAKDDKDAAQTLNKGNVNLVVDVPTTLGNYMDIDEFLTPSDEDGKDEEESDDSLLDVKHTVYIYAPANATFDVYWDVTAASEMPTAYTIIVTEAGADRKPNDIDFDNLTQLSM